MTKECWFTAYLYSSSTIITTSDTLQTVISSQVTSESNPMFDWGTVGTVGMYLCSDANLSGGKFRLGVWDSSGNPKAVSAQFTCADLAQGPDPADVEEFLISLTSTTTIADGDCVGIIVNELATGSGVVRQGSWVKSSAIPYWRRNIFVEGSSGVTNTSKILVVCLSTDFTPPSTASKIFSPPLFKSNVNIIPREFK